MSRRSAWLAAALLVAACSPPPAPEAPAFVDALPLRFTVEQRSGVDVDGTDGALHVSLGDISGGAVDVRAASPTLGAQLAEGRLHPGDALFLRLQDVPLRLELEALDTSLLGSDAATLVLRASADSAAADGQRIDALLAALAARDDCTFLRNGDEHGAAEAAEHLARKRAHAGDAVRTVDAFIERCATRSSLSGEPYRVRLADGREVLAADFLRGLAAGLEGGAVDAVAPPAAPGGS